MLFVYPCIYIWGGDMDKRKISTVQQWGNSVAVRIPAAIARKAHFVVEQPVEVLSNDLGIVVHRKGSPKLTLEQRLKAFDTTKHGGEVEASFV